MSPIATRRQTGLRNMVTVLLIAGVCLAAILFLYVQMHTQSASQQKQAADAFHRLNAAALEKEVRAALPLGTPAKNVIEYLAYRRVEFTPDVDKRMVIASVKQKTSFFQIILESESITFHFDDDMKLKSIDFRQFLTGP